MSSVSQSFAFPCLWGECGGGSAPLQEQTPQHSSNSTPVPALARTARKGRLAAFRARSSVGERSLHTREVAGSKPAAPIVKKARYGGLSAFRGEVRVSSDRAVWKRYGTLASRIAAVCGRRAPVGRARPASLTSPSAEAAGGVKRSPSGPSVSSPRSGPLDADGRRSYDVAARQWNHLRGDGAAAAETHDEAFARETHERWVERQHRPMSDPEYQDEWYAEQCGGCRFWIVLCGVLGDDYGVCANRASPRDGRVQFEHDDVMPSRPSAKASGAERRADGNAAGRAGVGAGEDASEASARSRRGGERSEPPLKS